MITPPSPFTRTWRKANDSSETSEMFCSETKFYETITLNDWQKTPSLYEKLKKAYGVPERSEIFGAKQNRKP